MSSKISLIGGRLDIEIRQGSTFRRTFTVRGRDEDGVVTSADLTGSEVRGQIRRTALDTTLVAAFTITPVDLSAGRVQLLLTDETTAAITCGAKLSDAASLYEYDVEVEDSLGDVVPVLQGFIRIKAEVTRP